MLGLGGFFKLLKPLTDRLGWLWDKILDAFDSPRRRNASTLVVSLIFHIALLTYLAVPRPPTFIYPPNTFQPPDVIVTMIPPPQELPPIPLPEPTPAPQTPERWPNPDRDRDRTTPSPAPAPSPPQAQPTPSPSPSPPAPIAQPTPTPPRPQPVPVPNAPPRPAEPPAPAPAPAAPAPPAPPTPRFNVQQAPAPVAAQAPNAIHRAPVAAPDSPIQSFRAPAELFTQGQAPPPGAAAAQPAAGNPGAAPGGPRPGGGPSAFPFGVLPGGGGGMRGGILACRDPDAYRLSQAERQRCLERLGAGANRVAPADPIAASRNRLNAEAEEARAGRAYRNSTAPGVGPSASDVPNRGGLSPSADGGPPGQQSNPAGSTPRRARDLPAAYSPPAQVGPGTGN